MSYPQITLITTDTTHLDAQGRRSGQVRHAFHSPTHWATICEVIEYHNPHSPVEVSLQYGSGGTNKDATDTDVALALAQTFTQAATLLARLGA